MNKKEFEFLSKVFEADIFNTKFYSESKLAKKLIEEGLIKEVSETLKDKVGVFTVKFLTLTALGHLTYCVACSDLYDIDDNGNIIEVKNE